MLRVLSVVALMLPGASWAQEASCGVIFESYEVDHPLCQCKAIVSATDRLDCYDRLALIEMGKVRQAQNVLRIVAQHPEGIQAMRDILAGIDSE